MINTGLHTFLCRLSLKWIKTVSEKGNQPSQDKIHDPSKQAAVMFKIPQYFCLFGVFYTFWNDQELVLPLYLKIIRGEKSIISML